MFDVFDYSGTITRVEVTPGYTAADGSWVPESTSSSSITGHITDVKYEELQFIDPGVVEKGVRKLTTEDTLDTGDRVQVDGVEYTVYSTLHGNNVITKFTGISRTTYIIQKI